MNALEWIDNEHGELHAKGDSGHEYQIYQYFHSPCQYSLCVDYSEQDREPQTEEGLKKLHDLANSLEAKFFAALALANGYVKADDLDAMKAKLAEVTDQLEDATDALDQIEAESACFDGLARSAGYVKLEPGQVVVNASDVGDALDALCDTCAGNCEMCPTREILFAIKEARDARV